MAIDFHRQKLKARGVIFGLFVFATSLPAAARSWNVEAVGTMLCDGQPMAGVQVDLMHSRVSWTDDFDGKPMATSFTDDLGRYHLRGAGGSILGPPAPYVRATYFSAVSPPSPVPTTRVIDEISRVRSDHGNVRANPWRPGVINMGVQNFSTNDCRLWRESRHALNQHSSLVPYRDLAILRWSSLGGTPFATLSSISWPTHYAVGRVAVFHEIGHTFRHSLDGSITHFLDDVFRFNYLRNHIPTDVTNEGFAFNEGWAIFWSALSRFPAARIAYANTSPNWSVEQDVAAYLRGLLDCGFTAETLWQILHDNPRAIHSQRDFDTLFRARFPRACAPPLPPLPSPPTACASGSISQQFYDFAVGCAGSVTQKNAGALCGPGFRLCGAREFKTARRNIVPEHNYWTSDVLQWDTYLHTCAARFSGGFDCGNAALHVCVSSGTDPEGNTCAERDCTLDPAVGTEFPANDFFGGCGLTGTDATAGAVCCPVTPFAAVEPVEGPAAREAVSGAEARSEHRAALEAAIARLEAELARSRQRAQPPAACPSEESCPALFALIEPSLLEGAIKIHRLELERLEATPEMIEEVVRQAGEQGLDAWQKTYAEHWSREILKAMAQALENARTALQPALKNPSTAEAARAAVADLEAQQREINRALEEPLGNPVLPPFNLDERQR